MKRTAKRLKQFAVLAVRRPPKGSKSGNFRLFQEIKRYLQLNIYTMINTIKFDEVLESVINGNWTTNINRLKKWSKSERQNFFNYACSIEQEAIAQKLFNKAFGF